MFEKNEIIESYTLEQCDGCEKQLKRKFSQGDYVFKYTSKCSSCSKILKGVPNIRATKLKRISKSKKRPSRPFGGELCSSCSRKELIKRSK